MSDLLWDEVRDFFDPALMGALPDVCVPGTSVEDWQTVFDLVRSSGWRWEYSEGLAIRPLPSAAAALVPRPADAETVDLRVWPTPSVLVIFRPMSADEIDFDVDLRELQGQEGVDVLCGFLATIGRALGKPVVMNTEGDWGHPVLGFEPSLDRVVRLDLWQDGTELATSPQGHRLVPSRPGTAPSHEQPPGGVNASGVGCGEPCSQGAGAHDRWRC